MYFDIFYPIYSGYVQCQCFKMFFRVFQKYFDYRFIRIGQKFMKIHGFCSQNGHLGQMSGEIISLPIAQCENRVLVLPAPPGTIQPSYWYHLGSIYRKNIFFQNSDPVGSKISDFQVKNDGFGSWYVDIWRIIRSKIR